MQAEPLFENLVKNGNFEKGLEGWAWTPGSEGTAGQVIAQAGLDAVTVFEIRKESADSPAARLSQTLEGLIPGARYTLTAWVKGQDSGSGLVRAGSQSAALPTGVFDWTKVEVPVWPDATRSVPVAFEVTGKTEELWISKVSVTPAAVASTEAEGLSPAACREQLERLQKSLGEAAAQDAEVRMGLAVARRYIERLETGGPNGAQGLPNAKPEDRDVLLWSRLQLAEVSQVLQRVARRVAAVDSGRTPPYRMPDFRGGRVTFDEAGFWLSPAGGGEKIPVVLGGYGFFDQVIRDLDFLHETGVSLIQQERGPRDLRADGSLTSSALSLRTDAEKAGARGIFTDVLLSPHYFPDWAAEQDPSVLLDSRKREFLKFKIDHPLARSVVEKWITGFVPTLRDLPGVWSVCLSNEAAYAAGGSYPESRDRWVAYLRAKHGAIEKLNACHGSHYAAFEEVPVPDSAYPAEAAARPAYYDWVRFNQENFAAWHRWMNDLVKKQAPELATHAKLVPDIFDTRPQAQRTHGGRLSHGVDPELITEFTDLAGCDSWNFITPDADDSYTWLRTQIWYDLLHSFRQRPVIDSELHFIHDRHPQEQIPSGHFTAVLWQGALHHRTAFVNWIWSEPTGGSSLGSIYLRPANVYAVGKALIDLNRLAPEVRAFNAAPPDVALLYSMPSLFWQEDYPQVTKDLYALLVQIGCKVTFVSERQLGAGELPPVKALFLPHATHVSPESRAALGRLLDEGRVRLIPVGTENLGFDEYNRPLAPLEKLPAPLVLKSSPRAGAAALAATLGQDLTAPPLLEAASGKRALGVDYRATTLEGAELLSLVNIRHRPITLKVEGRTSGTDLLAASPVNLSEFTLQPGEPMIIRVNPAPGE